MSAVLFAADSGHTPLWLWLSALVVAPLLLAVELFLIPRRNPIPVRHAVWYSLLWFVIGAAFALVVGAVSGEKYAIKYTSGFMVEKGLTIDQVLVFAFAVRRFQTPPSLARHVVFIALYVSLLLHIPFIALGVILGESDLLGMQVVFAALFFVMAVVLFRTRHEEIDPTEGWWARRLMARRRVIREFRGRSLVVRTDAGRELTLLGALLIVLLGADLFFSSTVPLAFSYSKPGFIVFASSTFAMLGFRSLYAAATGLRIDIAKLKVSLGCVFVVMGADLLLHPFIAPSEPEWLLPLLGFAAVMVPVISAVRGVEEELEEEHEFGVTLE